MKKLFSFVVISGFAMLLCAETVLPNTCGEDSPRKEMLFTRSELDLAYKELVKIIGDDLKAVAMGRKTKQEVAKTAEDKSRNSKYSQEVRFLLAKGAFGLYIDAGDADRAKALLIRMDLNEHYASSMLLDMMHESNVDFGIKCADTNCPLILSSLMSFGNIMDARNKECKESIGIGALNLGDTSLSVGAKIDNWHFGHNPIRIWEQGRISVRRKNVKLAEPIGSIGTAELYFTKESRRLYKIIFNVSYGSLVDREDACRDLEMVRALLKRWKIATYIVATDFYMNIDEQVEAHHSEALAKFRRNGYRDSGMMSTINSVSDFGIGDVRVDGDVSEDMHHCKTLRVCICDERLEALAWRECGEDPYAAKPLGGGPSYPSSIAWFSHMLQFDKNAKYIGRIGWGFEHGLYGMTSNRQNAVSFYRYAGIRKNVAALSRLSTLNESREMIDEDMSRVKAVLPNMRDENAPDGLECEAVPCAVKTREVNDDANRAELIFRGARLGREMMKLSKDGTVSTNGWGRLESLERARQIAEEMHGVMTNAIMRKTLSRQKYEEGIFKSRQSVADTDAALRLSRAKLHVTINGKDIRGATIEVGDCRFVSPVTIAGLKKGSQFGPYKISHEIQGKKYSTKFQAINVTWDGQKTFNCSLRDVP